MYTTKDSKQRAALEIARGDLTCVQRQLDADTTSLESARQLENATTQKLVDARQAAEADEAEQVLRLDASIRNGAALIGMPSSLDEGVKLELARATHASRIATLAVEAAAKRHAHSQAEVNNARAAVRALAKEVLITEGETIAAQIEEHERQAMALRENLLGLRGDEIHRRKDNLFTSRPIEQALGLSMEFSAPLRFCDVVMYAGPHRERIAAADQRWQERLAALIEGDALQADDSKAA
jgi:hypothetical protein